MGGKPTDGGAAKQFKHQSKAVVRRQRPLLYRLSRVWRGGLTAPRRGHWRHPCKTYGPGLTKLILEGASDHAKGGKRPYGGAAWQLR